jgi:serpin B
MPNETMNLDLETIVTRFCCSIVMLFCIGCGPRPVISPTPPVNSEKLIAGNTEFALDMYRQLCKKPGNIIISPFSLSAALALTSAGAQGKTLREFETVLHQPSLDQTYESLSLLRDYLRADPKQRSYELRIASGLWGQKGFPFRNEFQTLSKSHFGAALELERLTE